MHVYPSDAEGSSAGPSCRVRHDNMAISITDHPFKKLNGTRNQLVENLGKTQGVENKEDLEKV